MGDQQSSLSERLKSAAAALEAAPQDSSKSAPDNGASGLLQYLGYDDGNGAQRQGRVRMLHAAAQLRRLFLLPVPDAPGLIFFGGEADPAALGEQHAGLPLGNLAGSGLSPQRAFEACVGEGIEYLSQFVQADDPIESGRFADYCGAYDAPACDFVSRVLAVGKTDPDRSIAWVSAYRQTDGTNVPFPLDLCYRRRASDQDFKPPLKLSSGCAAGITVEAATLRGLLELVERDAVALWWRGGRRGRSVAPEAAEATVDLLAQLRQGNSDRKTWLLDITTDLEIPAVAAMSARPDGHGFAVGFGARLTLAEAARAAIFELCQVELGQHVLAAKRNESGDGALNEGDLRLLKRSTMLDTRHCALLEPDTGLDAISTECDVKPVTDLQDAIGRLASHHIDVYTIDLTRPQFGVPVVRVLAPALQLEPCEIVGERLARTIAAMGGGALHHGGIALF
jgi:ribosomal protein S12 methylthiotransferase accessory factor